jgi:hypothetical protein
MTFTVFKSPVILAGMPVSSHRDVKPQGDGNAKSSTYALSKLPSMALDFGIPAKMTAHIAIMRIAVGLLNAMLRWPAIKRSLPERLADMKRLVRQARYLN